MSRVRGVLSITCAAVLAAGCVPDSAPPPPLDPSVRIVDAGHDSNVIGVAYSPDGKLLASAAMDRTTTLWSVDSRKVVRTIQTASLISGALAFSPDGKLLATSGDVLQSSSAGSAAGRVRVWRVDTGELVTEDDSSLRIVTGLEFSPDGTTLVMASFDNFSMYRVGLLDLRSGRAGLTITEAGSSVSAAFSPDGRVLAIGGRTTRLVDPATGAGLGEVIGSGPTFSPDGSSLATVELEYLRIYDVTTRRSRRVANLGNAGTSVGGMAFNPSNGTLAVASGDGRIRLFDPASGRLLATDPGPIRSTIAAIAYSPDGSTLAVADNVTDLKLWTPPPRTAPSPTTAATAPGSAGAATPLR